MNAETLKLTALATITRSLMATGAGQVRWNSKVRAFLENLTTKSLDELMQDTFLETTTDKRELKLCVHVVKKKPETILYYSDRSGSDGIHHHLDMFVGEVFTANV
ncbi:hypothetical protein AnigIFM49718_001181 [Aspergillus niger]|nr:hypothetical protein AnigIFM49718_001181 [Aspergillus niger]